MLILIWCLLSLVTLLLIVVAARCADNYPAHEWGLGSWFLALWLSIVFPAGLFVIYTVIRAAMNV